MEKPEIKKKIKEIDSHLSEALKLANEIENNGGNLKDSIIIVELFSSAYNQFTND